MNQFLFLAWVYVIISFMHLILGLKQDWRTKKLLAIQKQYLINNQAGKVELEAELGKIKKALENTPGMKVKITKTQF